MKSNENLKDVIQRLRECYECYVEAKYKKEEEEILLENTMEAIQNLLTFEEIENS